MEVLQNKQSEIEVLGRILMKPELIYMVNDVLTSADFQDRKHKAVFEAMKACSRSGRPIEVGIMTEYLKDSEVSLIDLMKISGAVASTADIKYYVDIVKEAGKRVKLKQMLKTALADIDKKPYSEISDRAMKELYDINSDMNAEAHINAEQLMTNVLDYLQMGIDTDGKSMGIKTGWKTVDKPLKGLNKGDLVLLGARPSMGKTAWALNLATKISDENKILLFELEMKNYKIGMRQVSAKSGIHLNKLYEAHTMTQEEFSQMNKAVAELSAIPNFTIDDTPRVRLSYIRQKIHYLKETQGLDVVIIDHIGLIKEEKGFGSRNDWIGEVSASFKAMAKEFDINIIILSQLSRALESRQDKRPILSDLRDSGNLEQDADVVLFLYREGYYKPEEVAGDVEPLEVIVAKNRDGMTGTVEMAINLKIQRVYETYNR